MFDSGAGLNTIPEEAVLEVINVCESAGMGMGNPNHPIIQLETLEHSEGCRGVAGWGYRSVDRRREFDDDFR